MENGNIVGGVRGMHLEENPLLMSGYLGLFETCMSGYLGLFETCVTKFVQIWVSLLSFQVCLRFWFFGENVELFVFMGFFVCMFPRKILGLLVCWRLSWLLGLWVCFFGLFMVWFGFSDLFLVFFFWI